MSTPSGHDHAKGTSRVNVTESLFEYLTGHFHPVPVHLLPHKLSFAANHGKSPHDPKDSLIPAKPTLRLRSNRDSENPCSEPIGTRLCPDRAFSRQLGGKDFASSAEVLYETRVGGDGGGAGLIWS